MGLQKLIKGQVRLLALLQGLMSSNELGMSYADARGALNHREQTTWQSSRAMGPSSANPRLSAIGPGPLPRE